MLISSDFFAAEIGGKNLFLAPLAAFTIGLML